jgi:acetate kinase
VFTYRIKKYLGSYIAVLGGVDAIIFTGGIGENKKSVRDEACRGILCSCKKKPRILVIPTNEELMIARQTYALIKEN